MKQKLLTAGKRIAELETTVDALTDKEKKLRESGDEIGADELVCQINGYQTELDEQHRIFGELIDQSNAEAVSRKQTEEFWSTEFLSILLRMRSTLILWMKTHYLDGAELSLYDMFRQDHPGYEAV